MGGRTYVGAYALCLRSGQILLSRLAAHGPETGCWTLPGGGVEFGEAPNAAVLRELEEETGLRGRIRGVVGIYSNLIERGFLPPHEAIHHIGLVFEVETASHTLRNETEGSTDLCAWIPLDKARDLRLVPLTEFGLKLAGNSHSNEAEAIGPEGAISH